MAGRILKRTYLVLLFGFLYLPIAVLIAGSFNSSKSRTIWGNFTFDWYKYLFRDEAILQALGLSLVLAFLSAVIATLLGTVASVGILRMRSTPQKLTLQTSYVPIVNPEIITGVSMMLLFVVAKNGLASLASSDTGILAWLSNSIIGFPSLLIAHITFCLPYVIFNVVPKLQQMDIRLYEAALDLGCNERQAFFKVVLPEILPAVLSSFLICLTYSIDDFTISYFTAGTQQTLSIAIFSMTRKKVSPEINALSTVMFMVILTVIIIANARERSGDKKRRKALRVHEVHPNN